MDSKVCNGCKEDKVLSDYYKKCDTYDGLTSRCKVCVSAAKKSAYPRLKEKAIARNRAWWEKNGEAYNARRRETYDSEAGRASCRRYYQANKEKVRAANTAWDSANQETVRRVWREYAARNKANRYAIAAKRRAISRNAYPKWDRDLTKFVSQEANELVRLRHEATGIDWHVDHILPLAGKEVCGLHVWNNLQVIPAVINLRKSNRLEATA